MTKTEKLQRRFREMAFQIGARCSICALGFANPGDVTLDHVMPIALGGRNTVENWRPAHRHCNRLKEMLCDNLSIHRYRALRADRRFKDKKIRITCECGFRAPSHNGAVQSLYNHLTDAHELPPHHAVFWVDAAIGKAWRQLAGRAA